MSKLVGQDTGVVCENESKGPLALQSRFGDTGKERKRLRQGWRDAKANWQYNSMP
jgi:hypothetical protein